MDIQERIQLYLEIFKKRPLKYNNVESIELKVKENTEKAHFYVQSSIIVNGLIIFANNERQSKESITMEMLRESTLNNLLLKIVMHGMEWAKRQVENV